MNWPSGILIVDDDRDFSTGLSRLLSRKFAEERVETASTGQEALKAIADSAPAVMLTDYRMPGMDGLDLLAKALTLAPDLAVILLTGYGTIEGAVQALKGGAYDFLTKPVDADTLFKSVENALERTRLMAENQRLRGMLTQLEGRHLLIGESPAMQRLRATIQAMAESDWPVLIRGESGAGKEVIARAIHAMSRRAKRRFLAVNCPAIPEQLFESEIFGHVKGAFTGAERSHKGLLTEAAGGTILLDEIGDIPLAVQTKLLRCLQEREIRPVGGAETRKFTARVLASTNQDLERKIEDKRFREDLYYRLNVLTVLVPPLRERREDIPLLARHFLNKACTELGVPHKQIAPEVLAWLTARSWPGNVRQMQNEMRRLVVFCDDEEIRMIHVRRVKDQSAQPEADSSEGLQPYKEAKEELFKEFTESYVKRLLAETGGNISKAARLSGLSRVALQDMLKRLGLKAEEFR